MIAPLVVGGIIAGAVALAGAVATAQQNKKNRKYQEETNRENREHEKYMYELSRQDAQNDWKKQNEFNSPEQQMTRLRQAGLNPNLVYGNGATTTADTIRSGEYASKQTEAPKVDNSGYSDALNAGSNQLTMGFQMQQQQLQNKNIEANTSNLNEQNNLIKQEALLKQTTNAGQLIKNADSQLQYDKAKQLYDNSIKHAELTNLNMEQDLANKRANETFTLDSNDRAKVELTLKQNATASQIATQYEQILKSKMERAQLPYKIKDIESRIKALNIDTKIKKFQLELQKDGIQPGTSTYQRKMMEFLDNFPANITENESLY